MIAMETQSNNNVRVYSPTSPALATQKHKSGNIEHLTAKTRENIYEFFVFAMTLVTLNSNNRTAFRIGGRQTFMQAI